MVLHTGGTVHRVRVVLLQERTAAVITKLRNMTILGVIIIVGLLVVTDSGSPLGWPNITVDDGGGRRTITLIAYANNDSLEVYAQVQTSLQGVILNFPTDAVDDNQWEYEFEVEATEHVSIIFNTWVTRERYNDGSYTVCRVVDDGHTVAQEKARVPKSRRNTIAMCPYVA